MEASHNNPQEPWWHSGVVLFTKLSGWIAGPILLGVFIGRWLDRKYGTDPWLFLLTTGVAFLFSIAGIIRELLKEMKRIEEESRNNKGKK